MHPFPCLKLTGSSCLITDLWKWGFIYFYFFCSWYIFCVISPGQWLWLCAHLTKLATHIHTALKKFTQCWRSKVLWLPHLAFSPVFSACPTELSAWGRLAPSMNYEPWSPVVPQWPQTGLKLVSSARNGKGHLCCLSGFSCLWKCSGLCAQWWCRVKNRARQDRFSNVNRCVSSCSS